MSGGNLRASTLEARANETNKLTGFHAAFGNGRVGSIIQAKRYRCVGFGGCQAKRSSKLPLRTAAPICNVCLRRWPSGVSEERSAIVLRGGAPIVSAIDDGHYLGWPRKMSAAPSVERRRRYWSKEEKRLIVAESFEEGASVAEVTRRYDVNANQLFNWRRQLSASEPTERRRSCR